MELLTKLLTERMTEADIDEVLALIHKAIFHKDMLPQYKITVLEEWWSWYTPATLKDILKKRHVYVMRESEDGRVVACGSVSLNEKKTAASIDMVFTDPDHQKMGIGRHMVTCLEADELVTEVGKIETKVSTSAYKFYEKLGYRDLDGILQLVYDDRNSGALMEKYIGREDRYDTCSI
ncbi:MAG: GNAT family N-acetyltransferase [Lachnospiraceae bacterium]|nr:GNAT family N-acetyltransferase [Lachnospiraceae bacterium]